MDAALNRKAALILGVAAIAGGPLIAEACATMTETAGRTIAADDEKPAPISQAAKDALNKKYQQIVAKYQTAPASQPDAWAALTEVLEAVEVAEKPLKQANGQWVDDGAIPDFTAIFSETVAGDKPGAAAAAKLLTAYEKAGVWEKLDMVAARQRCVRPPFDSAEEQRMNKAVLHKEPEPWTGQMVDVLLPTLGSMRGLARATAAHMHLAAEKRDWPTVVADYRRIMALARVSCHDGVLISRLVGIAIGELGQGRAAAALKAAGDSPPDVLVSGLAKALEEQFAKLPSFKLHMEAERLQSQDALSTAFDKAGKPDLKWISRLTILQGDPGKKVGLEGDDVPQPGSTAKKHAEVFDSLEAWGDTPWFSNKVQTQQLDTLLAEVSSKNKYLMIAILVPAVTRARQADLQGRAGAAGLAAGLAIHQFAAKTGKLPKALGELGEAVAARFVDPYSGQPLIYKPSPDGKSFELWAVGFDRKDDGGKLKDGDPFAGATAKGEGFDFRVWPRNEK